MTPPAAISSYGRLNVLGADLEECTLDGALAAPSVALEAVHADPADRRIPTTALAWGATPMTADQVMRDGPGPLRRQPAAA